MHISVFLSFTEHILDEGVLRSSKYKIRKVVPMGCSGTYKEKCLPYNVTRLLAFEIFNAGSILTNIKYFNVMH